MISAQYLPLRAVFCRFYDVICIHGESVALLKRCYYSVEHESTACIMLLKWEWCNLLLLDTKENANS